jgi:hypothetical protein
VAKATEDDAHAFDPAQGVVVDAGLAPAGTPFSRESDRAIELGRRLVQAV